MNFSEIIDSLDSDKERLTVDRLAAIRAAEVQAAEEAERQAKIAERVEKGRVAEARHTQVRERYKAVFTMLANGESDPYACAAIKLGEHEIEDYGKGFIFAKMHTKATDGIPARCSKTDEFRTEFWFFAEPHPKHPMRDELFGYAADDKPRASRLVSLPRKTDWATALERIADEQTANIHALCDQATQTLDMIELAARDPKLNPHLASRAPEPVAPLQDATPVVQ